MGREEERERERERMGQGEERLPNLYASEKVIIIKLFLAAGTKSFLSLFCAL